MKYFFLNELQYSSKGDKMEDRIQLANKYIENNKQNILDSLSEILEIQSISSDPSFKPQLSKAAEWIENHLINIGIPETKILKTQQHPVVFGEFSKHGKEKPTVLIYGHYDVQPPDPLELWKTEPFSPTIIDNLIYARGASDMKGQLLVILSAIQAINATSELPINIKFMIEGEEEIGSPSIEEFLKSNRELFESDFVFNLDAGMISKTQPTIVYGLRGLAYFEIHIKGPGHDLHSGLFGGIVMNPIQALATIISGMVDDKGVIQLPGFYDDVLPLSIEEKNQLKKLGFNNDYYLDQTEAKALFGEEGYTSIERIGSRPTLDVNGIVGGYTGEGPKTVIPSKAIAKLSTRLVPNQTPEKVKDQLHEYMKQHAPNQIEWEVKQLSSDPACITDPKFYATRCFAETLQTVWGKEPIYLREGGSIPIVSHMQNILGIESILSGFGLPEDKIHSPNERMDLDVFWKGIETVIHYFFKIAENCK
jgi:acetylornithine deacetylase/succinyl-diaminopimelate desuccinylase-like protein